MLPLQIVLLFLLLLYLLALPFKLCFGAASPLHKKASEEAEPQSAPPRPSKHANGSQVPLQNVTISEPPVTPVQPRSTPFLGPTSPATPLPGRSLIPPCLRAWKPAGARLPAQMDPSTININVRCLSNVYLTDLDHTSLSNHHDPHIVHQCLRIWL